MSSSVDRATAPPPPVGELFDLVDEEGRVIGRATRTACHADPALLHRAVHVVVVNARGELFLQRRSQTKDIQPGKWDTSVGGHVALGESVAAAAIREAAEELGLRDVPLEWLHRYVWRSPVESELVHTYRCRHAGPFALQAEEIDDGRFFSAAELRRAAAAGELTPNLVHELGLLGLLGDGRRDNGAR